MYDPSEALLQLGLYDYVWGNPALLQTYNANVQADKARKEQQAYNSIWKNIELAKLNREKEKADALKLNELNKEFDELQYKLTKTQDPLEIAWIQKQMRKVRADAVAQGAALRGEDRDFDKSYAENRQYNAELNAFKKGLKRNFKTEEEKNAELEKIDKSSFRDNDILDMRKEISGIDSQQAKNEAARSQAVASYTGKKTGENLEEADISKKADEAIRNNTPPSEINDEKVIIAIGKKGRTWKANIKQWKPKGAK